MSDWSPDELKPRHSANLHRPTLFPVALETFEADTQVSADEMRRWHERGWLSFNPDSLLTFDWSEDTEVSFVKAIVRSGLGDEWIEKLLKPLPRPYCFDPDATFYSFAAQSWITLPSRPEPPSITDELDGYLTSLADEEQWDDLRAISETVEHLLMQETTEPKEDADAGGA